MADEDETKGARPQRMVLEASTAARLVSLRLLLHSSQAAATDQTSAGRLRAVVALDGVCELAIGLASRERNVRLKEVEGIPEQVRRLQGHQSFRRWKADGLKGVLELHTARNAAQHEGVSSDTEHVQRWSIETEKFVTALVAVAFDVDLHGVFAADAVETEDLRERLARAESLANGAAILESIKESRAAFELALSRFRSMKRDGGRVLQPEPLNPLGEIPGMSQVRSGIELLQRFLDIATFANDPGEWVWLESVTPEFPVAGDALTAGDAQRALTFALNWVLRYEAFAARYLGFERLYAPPPAADPSVDYPPPCIAGVELDATGNSPRSYGVRVDLEGVPPEWFRSAQSALVSRPGSGIFVSFPGSGNLLLHVPNDTPAAKVYAFVRRVIDETHAAFRAELDRRREGLSARVTQAEAFERKLKELDSAERTGDIVVEGPWASDNFALCVQVDLPGGIVPVKLQAAMNVELKSRGFPNSVDVDGDGVHTSPSWLPAQQFLDVLESALESLAAEQKVAQAQAEATEEKRRQTLEELSELIHRKGATDVS